MALFEGRRCRVALRVRRLKDAAAASPYGLLAVTPFQGCGATPRLASDLPPKLARSTPDQSALAVTPF